MELELEMEFEMESEQRHANDSYKVGTDRKWIFFLVIGTGC